MAKLSVMSNSLSGADQRFNAIQSDLAAIAYALGDARKFLSNRHRWFNACRDVKTAEPLRPYVIETEMLTDACRTVARCGTEGEKAAVRSAVLQYMDTRTQMILEPLADVQTQDVLKLCTETIKEGAEAQAAVVTALSTKSASDFETADRETLEEVTALERLREGLAAARARFITPRTNRLFAGAR